MAQANNEKLGSAMKWFLALGAGIVAVAGLGLSITQQDAPQLVTQQTATSATEIQLSDAQISAIAKRVQQQLQTAQNTQQANASNLDAQIEDYLLRRPEILISMSQALEAQQANQQQAQVAQFLDLNKELVYHSEHDVVVGNPDGDVTLVEFFDYNCHFCQQAAPEIIALLEEDKNLRVVFKEFPALSSESVEAARIAYLVGQSDKDYFSFHMDLMSARGTKNAQKALDLATELGLDANELQARMNDESVSEVLGQTQALAQQLGIRGTPAFIIGNEVVPGYIDRDEIKRMVANIRQCGSSTCNPSGS